MKPWTRIPGGVRLALHVQPRAARTGIAGYHDGALKLRVAAPPADGAANEAVIAWLAERLGVPRRAVRIKAGAGSRRKLVEIDGVAESELERAFPEPPPGGGSAA